MKLRLSTTTVLSVAFAVSTLSFLAATAVTAHTEHSIGNAAVDIATVASPADSQVHAIRTDLRRIDVALALEIGARDERTSPPPERLDALVRNVNLRLSRYFASPAFPAEKALRPIVLERWQAAEAALADVRTVAQAGGYHAAFRMMTGRYRLATDALDAALVKCVETNVEEAAYRGTLISRQWSRARSIGFAMTLLSVLFTLGTAVMAIRFLRQQTRLLARRADESVQFAGRVAHDVLSPVAPVQLFLDLAASKGLDNPAVARGLPVARSALKRLVSTVDGLLEFAKAGAQAPEGAACDAREVVRGVVNDQRSDAERQQVVLHVSELPEGQVRCASGVLASVLSNLIRNAVKYMGDAEVRQVTIRALRDGARMRFEVADTGPGIAPRWHRTIFEPLVRLPSEVGEGIGLGLATVRRLVVGHGGQVGMESAPGRGSRFWFSLPVTDPLTEQRRSRAA
jgi:signal transduction histidine kinase